MIKRKLAPRQGIEWEGAVCGIRSPIDPLDDSTYAVGDRDECVLCDSPAESACMASIVRKRRRRGYAMPEGRT